MARRKRTGNRTFPKRATLWMPFDSELAMTTAGTPVQTSDLLGNYFAQTGAELPVGSTIGPFRGIYVLRPTVATTANDNFTAECVVQLVREGGRATDPVPGVDIMDGMWYGQIAATARFGETASGVFSQLPTEKVFESKAMRKITGNGQELRATAVANQNTDYSLRFIGVLLIRLP